MYPNACVVPTVPISLVPCYMQHILSPVISVFVSFILGCCVNPFENGHNTVLQKEIVGRRDFFFVTGGLVSSVVKFCGTLSFHLSLSWVHTKKKSVFITYGYGMAYFVINNDVSIDMNVLKVCHSSRLGSHHHPSAPNQLYFSASKHVLRHCVSSRIKCLSL